MMMQILWPAFLIAIIAEGLLFSVIDPQELQVFGTHFEPREAAYTVVFFVLWALFTLSSALTFLLSRGRKADRLPGATRPLTGH